MAKEKREVSLHYSLLHEILEGGGMEKKDPGLTRSDEKTRLPERKRETSGRRVHGDWK